MLILLHTQFKTKPNYACHKGGTYNGSLRSAKFGDGSNTHVTAVTDLQE